MKVRKRILIICGIGAVLLCLITLGLYSIISPYYSNRIDIVEKPSIIEKDNWAKLPETKEQLITSIYKEEQKEDEIINILLCGMDAREYETNSRSDTIILASYNKTNHTVKLVSFMRDTWVYIPEHGWGRINSATSYGGTGLLVNTLNYNFDLDIQNYVQIKFDDFKKVIDILGGIDVDLTKQEINYINRKLHSDDRDYKNDIQSEPGLVHLNGTQALWHCRNRSIGNSDFSRTERQRTVLSIIINKVMSMDIGTATTLLYEMKDYVNMNVPLSTVLDLGSDAILSGSLTVESSRIPYDDLYKYGNKSGASVLDIDFESTVERLHEFLGYDTVEDGENAEGIGSVVDNEHSD